MPNKPTRMTLDDLLAEARAPLERLTPGRALAAQHDGALLIDTRSSDERRRAGVIPGSLHVPLSVLEWRLDPDADRSFHNRHIHDLGQWLILVCEHGCSTSLAASRLQALGFSRATDLVGGFAAWSDAGLPVRPAPAIDDAAVPGMGDPEPS